MGLGCCRTELRMWKPRFHQPQTTTLDSGRHTYIVSYTVFWFHCLSPLYSTIKLCQLCWGDIAPKYVSRQLLKFYTRRDVFLSWAMNWHCSRTLYYTLVRLALDWRLSDSSPLTKHCERTRKLDVGTCLHCKELEGFLRLLGLLRCSPTVHNLRSATCNLKYKIWRQCWCILKQNKRKASKSVDTMRNNLDGDVSFNKFVKMFDSLL